MNHSSSLDTLFLILHYYKQHSNLHLFFCLMFFLSSFPSSPFPASPIPSPLPFLMLGIFLWMNSQEKTTKPKLWAFESSR